MRILLNLFFYSPNLSVTCLRLFYCDVILPQFWFVLSGNVFEEVGFK